MQSVRVSLCLPHLQTSIFYKVRYVSQTELKLRPGLKRALPGQSLFKIEASLRINSICSHFVILAENVNSNILNANKSIFHNIQALLYLILSLMKPDSWEWELIL